MKQMNFNCSFVFVNNSFDSHLIWISGLTMNTSIGIYFGGNLTFSNNTGNKKT